MKKYLLETCTVFAVASLILLLASCQPKKVVTLWGHPDKGAMVIDSVVTTKDNTDKYTSYYPCAATDNQSMYKSFGDGHCCASPDSSSLATIFPGAANYMVQHHDNARFGGSIKKLGIMKYKRYRKPGHVSYVVVYHKHE